MESSTTAADAVANLAKVDHIVVLMMENRSFDHMLGYLRLDGVRPEVDGLRYGMGNEDEEGRFYEVEPIGGRLLHEKVLDPGHDHRDTAEQLSDSNGGFVRNYAKVLERNKRSYPDYPPDLAFDVSSVLGYQTAADVPVYDYVAQNFLVCDRWFSSVPGPTWPNRLYAVTGGVGRRVSPLVAPVPSFLQDAPLYNRPAFVRWLSDDDWRWYSHDPATLRLLDSRYRPGGEPGSGRDENFAYFNRESLFERRTFFDDAREAACLRSRGSTRTSSTSGCSGPPAPTTIIRRRRSCSGRSSRSR